MHTANLRSHLIRSSFLLACLFLQIFCFPHNIAAQIADSFQFDASVNEEVLRDQEILREQMRLNQEILREEMEKIRVETQKIMKDISLAMKEEAVKLKE